MVSHPHILVVDDDLDTCEMTAFVLKDAGFAVTYVTSGNQALSEFKSQAFDVLIVDNWMPGMSGIEFCKAVRESDHRIPILFMSAAAFEADEEEAILAGAQYYLTKPFSPDRLIEVVSNLIPPLRRAAEA